MRREQCCFCVIRLALRITESLVTHLRQEIVVLLCCSKWAQTNVNQTSNFKGFRRETLECMLSEFRGLEEETQIFMYVTHSWNPEIQKGDADMYLVVVVATAGAKCLRLRNRKCNVLRCTLIKRSLGEGETSGIQCL